MTEPNRDNWATSDGQAVLYCSDCMEIMPTLGKVDAVITDPPYGDDATHAGHLSNVTLRDGTPAGKALGFGGISSSDMVGMAREWCNTARGWVVFTCEWKHCLALDDAGLLVRFGIWRKPDGAPQFTGDRPGMGWEAIAICHRPGKKRWNGGGKHAVYTHCKGENRSGHPTGKPLPLIREFILDFTNEGDLVLDPFMGSGTTGVACMELGRRFIGIEIDPKYFGIARDRIAKAHAQGDLFIERPASVQEGLAL